MTLKAVESRAADEPGSGNVPVFMSASIVQPKSKYSPVVTRIYVCSFPFATNRRLAPNMGCQSLPPQQRARRGTKRTVNMAPKLQVSRSAKTIKTTPKLPGKPSPSGVVSTICDIARPSIKVIKRTTRRARALALVLHWQQRSPPR
jgi:hypothetical protein